MWLRGYRQGNIEVEWLHYRFGISSELGGIMDNLYAATIAGDLGQTACYHLKGQPGYIGPGTEMTSQELVGDIDGLLVGLYLSSNKKPSEILTQYYLTNGKYSSQKRYPLYEAEDGSSTLSQGIKFANNYIYKVFGKSWYSVKTSTDDDVYKAYNDMKLEIAKNYPATSQEVQKMLTKDGNLFTYNKSPDLTPIWFKKEAGAWYWGADKSHFQPVTDHYLRGPLPFLARGNENNRVPGIPNLRIIKFLAKTQNFAMW